VKCLTWPAPIGQPETITEEVFVNQSTRRRLPALTLALVLGCAALATPGGAASAGTTTAAVLSTATPPGTYGLPQQWGVQGYMQDGGTLDHSDVQAFTESNGMVFVGGNFARVQKGATATGADRVEQPYLAAFTAGTATYVPGFRPKVNDQVRALATLPDGTVLVGGDFTIVNGVASAGIAALNPLTGQVVAGWKVRLEQRSGEPLAVRDIEVRGDKVFIAGSFTHVSTGGHPTSVYARNLVQVTTTDPRVNTAFRPHPNAVVKSISVSPDASMLYLAGRFTAVVNASGQAVKATKVTGVRTSDGQQQPGMAAPTFSNTRNYQQAVKAVGSRVYYGGAEHMLFGVDPATFQRRSASITQRGGDFQVIEKVGGGVILAGCHCYQYNYLDATTFPITTYTRRDPIKFVGAWDAATGDYLPQFVPVGVRTRNSHGAWAILKASNGDVWVGGDFTGIQMQPGQGTKWTGGFFRLPHTVP
jgi:hypothetical protein